MHIVSDSTPGPDLRQYLDTCRASTRELLLKAQGFAGEHSAEDLRQARLRTNGFHGVFVAKLSFNHRLDAVTTVRQAAKMILEEDLSDAKVAEKINDAHNRLDTVLFGLNEDVGAQ